jgi:glycosyltransferase involved in cell wall biosynthesis
MLQVTAIIPTYQRPTLLQRALRSVAAQQRAVAEVIVVDDADSLAVTRQIVEACGLPHVLVVANARARGASGARNTGAALSTGELLAFLDDDDEWLPTYLCAALAQFDTGGCDIVCTDLLYQFEDGTECPGKSAPDHLATELFLTTNPGLIGSNVIIRQPLYRALGGFDESLLTSEDMDFGIRLSLCDGVRYHPLRQRLVRHYQHTGPRLCTSHSEPMWRGVRRFYEASGGLTSTTCGPDHRLLRNPLPDTPWQSPTMDYPPPR